MNTLKTFLAVLLIGPALDFFWFSLIASDLYKKELGSILRMKDEIIKPEIFPAILVYILTATLIVFFVLPKVGAENSILTVFLWGALAGLVTYGIYDFTNLSFLKDWTLTATIVDVLWGTFMVGVMTVIARYLSSWFA